MRTSTNNVVLLFALFGVASPVWARGAVIANLNCQESKLSVDAVRDIFLGKDREYPGGGTVEPVNQSDDAGVSQEFMSKVLNKTPRQLKSYWSLRIFTGRGTPPRTFFSDSEVKEWVAKHPEALGYIDAKNADANVKVLVTFD